MKVIIILSAAFIVSCLGPATVKDENGNKVSVTNQALFEAEETASECLVESSKIHLADSTAFYASITSLAENVQSLLILSRQYEQGRTAASITAACFAPVEVVLQQGGLTDRQKMNSNQRIISGAIIGGVTYATLNSFFGSLTAIAASGAQYNINGAGGRQVIQNDDPISVDSGLTANVFGGDQTVEGGQAAPNTPPGAVSASGTSGDVIGNTQSVTISGKDGSSGLSIGTNSNDPAVFTTEGPEAGGTVNTGSSSRSE